MDKKKGLFLTLAVILVSINLISFFVTFSITGDAVSSSTGTSSICINNPPTISEISDQTANESIAFTLNISTTDANNNVLTFFDNTSLFNIDQNGLISFTPSGAAVEDILITIQDDSSCTNSNASETFSLTITGAAEEEAPGPSAPSAGGGGGGGSVSPKKPEEKEISFKISDQVLKVALKQTKTIQKIVTITNDGETELSLEIVNPLEPIVEVVPSSFTLQKNEKQNVRFVFNPTQETTPGIYSDFITVKGTFGRIIKKDIATVLEVESEEVLVDASLDLLKKSFFSNEELEATITLFNLRQTVPAEVTIIYLISKFNNSIVYEEKETIIVKDQASFSKKISLPEGLGPGQYVFSVKIIYEDSFATATEIFIIEEPPVPEKKPLLLQPAPLTAIIIILIVLTTAILVLLYFTHRKIRKTKTRKTVIKQKTVVVPRTIVKKEATGLRRKLSLLRESKEKGFIRSNVYKKTRSELKKLIRKREK